MRIGIAAAALLLSAGIARADVRPLDVPVTKGWQHARTGLILTAHLGGLSRRKLGDYGVDEMDVVAEYDDGDGGTIGTVYLFHPGLNSLPVWFDRSQAAILATKRYGSPAGTSMPRPFAIPPGTVTDSLRIAYSMQGGTLAATALAMVPVGEWLLAVRLSSNRVDADTLDQKMTALLRDIRWPAGRVESSPAVPVDACATALRFHKAQLLPADMTQALLNAIAPKAAADEAAKNHAAPAAYCRDKAGPDGQWAVYRANSSPESYMVALGDNGRAIGVGPALILSGPRAFAVRFYDLSAVRTYPNVTALLPPEQAIALTNQVAPVASTSMLDGKTNLTINANALPKK